MNIGHTAGSALAIFSGKLSAADSRYMGEPFLVILIKPPPDVAAEMDFVRRKLGINRRYSTNKLHITVQPLGYRKHLSDNAITSAMAASAALMHPPFHVVFDRVNGGKLEGSEPIRGFIDFRTALQNELSTRVIYQKHVTSPHVTLAYGAGSPSSRIDAISWLVEEFQLIESFQGEGRHKTIAHWKLRR